MDILEQVTELVAERDDLRQRNTVLEGRNQELDALARRQGVVIAKFADAMTELQAFLDEMQLVVEPPAATPPKSKSARRYTDDDAREWASALRQGKTQLEVSEIYGVTTNTIKARLERLGYDPKTGLIEEPESADNALDPEIVVYDDEEDADRPPFLRPSNGNGHGSGSAADAAGSS